MATFHAFLGCSLDGYIAGPDGELDWLTVFDNTGYDAFFDSIDVMAMGRSSYDTIRAMDPDYYRGKPIHVLSTTLPAGSQAVMGDSPVTTHRDIDSLTAALSSAGAERVYVDGGRTVQAFLAAGMLSDLTVTRVPVVLGGGIPLFGSVPAPVTARLRESAATAQGAVQSVYEFPVVGPVSPSARRPDPAR